MTPVASPCFLKRRVEVTPTFTWAGSMSESSAWPKFSFKTSSKTFSSLPKKSLYLKILGPSSSRT
eukprot:CAMPEP_0170560214 /NCGR_PEP_ID=MMETSP0211-20121228/47464_1 /TAXON_ID=311385 /ORGANISM="Pseudokeronopsis sp., Strain OXSARD2" /LENGTH=64 /DNA_ID=CAMNT_0010874105 /DNA_START=518 /DNA_END=708 /DNA_ORIENTATION=+